MGSLMAKGIRIEKVWSDVDVQELKVEVSDGNSSFSNQVYVGHADLAQTVSNLSVFREQIHGGLLDLRFGEFGPDTPAGPFTRVPLPATREALHHLHPGVGLCRILEKDRREPRNDVHQVRARPP